ncbi:MAG: hypothetical protein U1F43_08960 [Myxococcota bacterium]
MSGEPAERGRVGKTLGLARDLVRTAASDVLVNARHAKAERRFLVVRHPSRPFFYDVLLGWLELFAPEVRARFELRALPLVPRDLGRYALHIPWLQDPVEDWAPTAFRLANALAERCDARGIAVVNRVDRLARAAKSEGARRIATAGLRTPAMRAIDHHPSAVAAFRADGLGLALPLFVREDRGHRGEVVRVDRADQLARVDVAAFARPIAVELIDVAGADGLFRKYRYIVAGDIGLPLSQHVARDWCVRGSDNAYDAGLRAEEEAFQAAPHPLHQRFVAAREALGLDFVAFDYGVTATGEVVVWEANPYPAIHFPTGRRHYRVAPTARALAAMAHLYLTRAGLEVPATIARWLDHPSVQGLARSP